MASGEGSNFEALVAASRSGHLKAEIVGLVTNRSGVGALVRAERLNVPARVLNPKTFATRTDWDHAVTAQLRSWGVDWVVLAGFLALIGPEVLSAYPDRIVNIHPSLLPKHGGPGMYGDRVHAAVLAAGDLMTGITVHLIDAEYDRGRIVAQTQVAVHEGDTTVTLGARVRAEENRFYPRVLNDLIHKSG